MMTLLYTDKLKITLNPVLIILFLFLPVCYMPADQTQPKPLKIIVFSGHTGIGENSGVKSSSGIFEIEYNDILSKKLASLQDKNIEYLLVPVSEKVSLKERPGLAAKYKADLILEIHHDSAQQGDIDECLKDKEHCREMSGFSVFFSSESKEAPVSKELAVRIGKGLRDAGFKPNLYHAKKISGENRKIISENEAVYDVPFYILKNTDIPAILIEAGVIANPFEEKEISNTEYHSRFAKAVHETLIRYILTRGYNDRKM